MILTSRVALLWCVFLCAARGQSTFGTIVGTVQDPSGAIVAAATVTAVEADTGVEAAIRTGPDGLFELPNLKPGRYTLTAGGDGFAPSNALEVALDSRRIVRVTLQLSLAPLRQALTVEEAAVGINTEDGTISHSLNFAQINQLPLNYRAAGTNPNALMFTIPGVRGSGLNETSLAGGFPAQVEYSIDGISIVDVRFNQPLLIHHHPSPEALREFKVTSVDATAEFGQMGDVALITRGGTNQFHGSLLWYHQNAAMDAKTYGAPIKQAKVFNTFGGSVGGPLSLPGVYRGRDKTFFFFAYEGNRRPGNILRQASVPTTQMWQGQLNGLPGPAVLDPLTGQPFPGNAIPAARINPVATNLAGFYPAPNVTGGSTLNNYRALILSNATVDTYNIRFDHTLTSRQQMFVRWTWADVDALEDRALLLPPSRTVVGSHALVFSHNFAVTPTLTNEFRFGLTKAGGGERFPIRGTDAVKALGLEGVDLRHVGDAGGFPTFVFSDGTGFTQIGHGRELQQFSRNLQFTDNLTWIRGRHTWKFGADIRRLGYDETLQFANYGDFGLFLFNGGAFSGNAFADLLLGLPSLSSFVTAGPNLNQRAVHSHFYVEDRWQVAPRLTLTLGLRWQVHQPMTEAAGNLTNFDRVTGNVIIPDNTLPPSPGFLASSNACPGTTTAFPCTKIVTASQVGLGPGLRKTPYGNWAPRVGFAFRPFQNNQTVLRGGFGIYTHTVLGAVAIAMAGIHTADFRQYQNFRPGLPPLFTFPQTASGSFNLNPAGNASFRVATNPDYRDPRSYQWNFTVEQQLRASLSMRVSYIATQSVGITMRQDLNQVPASTTPFSASRKPYPVWNEVLSLDNLGFANFQSMETEITQRFSRGVSFQAAYTLAKHLGNAGGPAGGLPGPQFSPVQGFPAEENVRIPTDRFNLRLDRGNLIPTRRHRFVLNGILPLPVGRNRLLGTRLPTWAETLLGGWDLSTVMLIQSGVFQTPTIATQFDQSNTNALFRSSALARPDRIGDGNLGSPTPDRFYDINAFTAAPAGSGRFGNAGVGILRGPHMAAISAGLFKTLSLGERARLRFEATFTNLPNHPNFYGPAVNVSNPVSFGKLTQVLRTENGGNRTGQVGVRLEF